MLTDVKIGDEVAVLTRGVMFGSQFRFNRIETVKKRTPKLIWLSFEQYKLDGRPKDRRSNSMIRIPTTADRNQHALKQQEAKKRQELEAEEQRLRNTPQASGLSSIGYRIQSMSAQQLYDVSSELGLGYISQLLAVIQKHTQDCQADENP